MATQETMWEQAVRGLDVALSSDVARVRDGNDTWLCPRGVWDGAEVALGARPALEDDEGGAEAYTEVCRVTARAGLIVSLSGSSHGEPLERARLVAMAVRDGLLDADEPIVRQELTVRIVLTHPEDATLTIEMIDQLSRIRGSARARRREE